MIGWGIPIVGLLVYGAILLALSGISPRKIIGMIGFVRGMITKEMAKKKSA